MIPSFLLPVVFDRILAIEFDLSRDRCERQLRVLSIPVFGMELSDGWLPQDAEAVRVHCSDVFGVDGDIPTGKFCRRGPREASRQYGVASESLGGACDLVGGLGRLSRAGRA